MVPLVAAAARYVGVSWVMNNVVGANGAAQNLFNPQVTTSPPLGGVGDFPTFFSGQYRFNIQTLAPSDKDMKALDDYFESFGYNIQSFGTVNLKVRGTFTYIKTRDAQVTSTNLEAANQMAAMLNGGIKFWATEIGV